MTLDAAYVRQRQRLKALVARYVAAAFTANSDPGAGAAAMVPVVQGGQRSAVALVGAYMAAKAAAHGGAGVRLDPGAYLELRNGVVPAEVYARPYAVMRAALARTDNRGQALKAGRDQATKLATTDLQLAQTHAARDWMLAARIVGYRRVLSGPGPHCALCTLASTRTYHVATLMPIHEHCGCTVEPLWGTEPVPSVGTQVRVENDPELGPRLMATEWSEVGPALIV